MIGRVTHIGMSNGGVPKLGVESAEVGLLGLVGDSQNDTEHHGGAERAVCLYSAELIERLRGEGHPIGAGTTGENVTLEGLAWEELEVGSRLVFAGGVELEVTSYAQPCSTIRESFVDGGVNRIKQALHPGESRLYARVLNEGTIATGEEVRVTTDE